jgi:hypothetical protein
MPEFQISYFRSKTDPMTFAVSPDPNGLVFPKPAEWEFQRTETLNPDVVFPGSELAGWLAAFKRDGYCILANQR